MPTVQYFFTHTSCTHVPIILHNTQSAIPPFLPPIHAALCDPLSDPGFGTVTLSGTEIGDTAMYQCVSGFVLDGPEIRTCNQLTPGVADWSEDAPVCIR